MSLKIILAAALAVALAAGVLGVFIIASSKEVAAQEDIVVYKSPSCGCCSGYVKYLSGERFNVKVVESNDLDNLKQERGVPSDMQSCHTSIIGPYFVEGHIPIEAVRKLLSEKPDIDGIAMPGMPAGSPGMGGRKTGEFVVYAVKDGSSSEFMRI